MDVWGSPQGSSSGWHSIYSKENQRDNQDDWESTFKVIKVTSSDHKDPQSTILCQVNPFSRSASRVSQGTVCRMRLQEMPCSTSTYTQVLHTSNL